MSAIWNMQLGSESRPGVIAGIKKVIQAGKSITRKRNRMEHFFAVLVVFRQMNEPMPPAMQKSGGRKQTDHRNRLPDKLGQNCNFTRKWTGEIVHDYIKIKSALEGS